VFLSRVVKQSGADEPQIDAFMTCAKELILNAHRHGHKYDETKQVTVRYRDQGGKLVLIVEDQGEGFDHQAVLAAVRSKDAATAARERYLAGGFGGLGFQLITRLSESLVYNKAGNHVTVTIAKTAPPDEVDET
jgi:anti-sigma regulatory factor (Ser/Thr protein kinase)